MKEIELLAAPLRFFVYAGILILLCFLTGAILNVIAFKVMKLYNRKREVAWIKFLIKHLQRPMHFFVPFLLILITLPIFSSYSYFAVSDKVIYILFCISFGWVLIRLIYAFTDSVLANHSITIKNNLRERKLITQIQFLRRLSIVIIVIVFVSVILLDFENVRKIGTGILTSAGILGIIIGFAAQKSLGNLLAGFQIAFSQPIRMDDVVIVENEWGNIEEITLTYVIIRLWDLRRLVVPLNYFIEKPFQNWTKTSADILGTVFLYLDYSISVDELRKEFDRLIKTSPLWDGKTSVLQVTNTTEKTIEIRALMSSENAGNSYDLRCYIREKLISFVQTNYPDCLPRMRTEINMKPGDV
jgi:small-conductance mechanosensitive channel